MTKQFQSSNSGSKRCIRRRLIRSTIAAGFVISLVSSAAAQTDLVLPSFPTSSHEAGLPVASDFSNPTHGMPTTLQSSSAFQKVSKLLGLNAQTRTAGISPQTRTAGVSPQTRTAGVSPASPTSNSETRTAGVSPATWTAGVSPASLTSQPAASPTAQAHVPSISQSSGSKSAGSQEQVILASANQASETPTPAPQDSLPISPLVPELIAEGGSADESLIDIELPAPSFLPSTEFQQRLPELVKRPPAMQLSIGGKTIPTPSPTEVKHSAIAIAVAPAATATGLNTTAKFTLSDTNGDSQNVFGGASVLSSDALRKVSQPVLSNPMNVQIEGETAVVLASTKPKASEQSTLQPSSEISSRGAAQKSIGDMGATPRQVVGERLEVGLRESINIEMTQAVNGLSIEHPELCQVLKTSERGISIVGLRAGQTRVALFTGDSSGERHIEIREVVIAGTESREADMKSLAAEISRSVHDMYPKSHIEIISEAEGLTVQGYADSEDEAKKIIGLIRRTSLQPVVDRLATYK